MEIRRRLGFWAVWVVETRMYRIQLYFILFFHFLKIIFVTFVLIGQKGGEIFV